MHTPPLAGLVILLGSFALLLAGCGPTIPYCEAGCQSLPQALHLAWPTGGGTDISTLDPGKAFDGASVPIVDMIFDGLVTLDHNLNVVAWGADKITLRPDGKTYVFHLRQGQKFSDGTLVKPSDYAYAMNRSESPCLASQASYYLWAIKDAQAFANETCDPNGKISGRIKSLIGDSIVPDDGAGTLTITLAAPAGYFLDAMTHSTSYALEQSVVTGVNLGADSKWPDTLKNGPTGQGGSGMFYVAVWDHQGNLVLKANPNWWGVLQGKKAYLTEVDFKLFTDSSAMYDAYTSNNGGYDFVNGIPGNEVAAARSQPDFHTFPALAVQTIAMNWNIAPFDNLDARTAFCLAINRDTLSQTVFKGTAISSWHLVPKGMPGYNPSVTGPDGVTTPAGDPALAQSHWNAYLAAVGGKVPKIAYIYAPSSQTSTLYAQTLIDQWNHVLPGADVTGDASITQPIRNQEQNKTLQMYRFGWAADYPDPQDFLSLLYATGSSFNDNNIHDPVADQLMAQADAIDDPSQQAKRTQLYNQAEQELINKVAVCPIVQSASYYRLRTYIHNFALDAQGQVATTDWPNVYLIRH